MFGIEHKSDYNSILNNRWHLKGFYCCVDKLSSFIFLTAYWALCFLTAGQCNIKTNKANNILIVIVSARQFKINIDSTQIKAEWF